MRPPSSLGRMTHLTLSIVGGALHQARGRTENVLSRQTGVRGDASILPVLHALDAARQVITERTSDIGRAAKAVDQRGIGMKLYFGVGVHARIKRYV